MGFQSIPNIQSMPKESIKQQRGEKDTCNRETEQVTMSCLALGIENLFLVKGGGATMVKIL